MSVIMVGSAPFGSSLSGNHGIIRNEKKSKKLATVAGAAASYFVNDETGKRK